MRMARAYRFTLDGKRVFGSVTACIDNKVADPKHAIAYFKKCAPDRISNVVLLWWKVDAFTHACCDYDVQIVLDKDACAVMIEPVDSDDITFFQIVTVSRRRKFRSGITDFLADIDLSWIIKNRR